MVRTADLGPIGGELALIEHFNHAIAYLPEDDLWLDGTAAGHALLPPPGMDQGAVVLVVNGADSRPETPPIVGAGIERRTYRLAPAHDGRVALTVKIEDSGEAADRRRARFAGSNDQRPFAAWLQEIFPGAELVAEPKLQLVPSRDPAIIELEAIVPGAAVRRGGGIAALPAGFDLPQRVVPTDERSGPLQVAVRPDLEWILEVDLGRPPVGLPDDLRLAGSHGSLDLVIEPTGGGYRLRGYFHLEPGLIAASEAAELRRFLLEVETILERPLETP